MLCHLTGFLGANVEKNKNCSCSLIVLEQSTLNSKWDGDWNESFMHTKNIFLSATKGEHKCFSQPAKQDTPITKCSKQAHDCSGVTSRCHFKVH